MMRDDASVDATWDGTLEAWVADAAAPGSGSDLSVGPAGPAGVCVFRSEGAALSTDLMTGRVTSLWFEEDPSDGDRALLDLVLDEGSADRLDAPAGSPDLELGIVPVAERTDAALLAILADTERHVPLSPSSAGAFLIQAELAAVITRLRAKGHTAMAATEIDRCLAEADRIASNGQGRSLVTRLPDGVQFDPVPVRSALRSIADTLRHPGASEEDESPTVKLLLDAVYDLEQAPIKYAALGGNNGLERDDVPRFRGPQPVPFPELFAAPAFSLLRNDAEPEPGKVAVRTPVKADNTFELGELARRQVGLLPSGGTLRLDGAWCTIRQPIDPHAKLAMSRWVIGYRDGAPVGASPCTSSGDDARACFTVTAPPDEVAFTANPLRVDPTAHLARLVDADRLCRAAFWARRRNDPRADTWFAHGAVAWFELGRTFRAGWAWRLADQDLVRDVLESRADGEDLAATVASLEAVVASGDLPGTSLLDVVPTPAWVYAVDLEKYAQGSPNAGGA
jgi:hypothetical protein